MFSGAADLLLLLDQGGQEEQQTDDREELDHFLEDDQLEQNLANGEQI